MFVCVCNGITCRQVEEAKRQLRLAERAEPGSRLAEQARKYLRELSKVGTG